MSQIRHLVSLTLVSSSSNGLFLSDPPHIKGSGVPAEVAVVVNNVLELQCEASGIPTPSLTWLKDGRPLPQTDSLRLLHGGEVLRVASAQVSHQDYYSEILFLMLSIKSYNRLCTHKHMQFMWFCSSDTFYLTFFTCTQLEDTGRYSCLAISPAGDNDKHFLVRVHGEYIHSLLNTVKIHTLYIPHS